MLEQSDFWSQIRDYYRQGTFCDLELLPGDSSVGLRCHRLVLASLSSVLRSALRATSAPSDDAQALTSVLIPDFSHQELKLVLDSIYESLVDQASFYHGLNLRITEMLGLLAVPKVTPMERMPDPSVYPQEKVFIRFEVIKPLE